MIGRNSFIFQVTSQSDLSGKFKLAWDAWFQSFCSPTPLWPYSSHPFQIGIKSKRVEHKFSLLACSKVCVILLVVENCALGTNITSLSRQSTNPHQLIFRLKVFEFTYRLHVWKFMTFEVAGSNYVQIVVLSLRWMTHISPWCRVRRHHSAALYRFDISF